MQLLGWYSQSLSIACMQDAGEAKENHGQHHLLQTTLVYFLYQILDD
jgi:hypothetical protein